MRRKIKSVSIALRTSLIHDLSRLFLKKILFFLKRKSIPLDCVTDFVLVQGPLMRLCDVWSLQIQTASTGTAVPEATLIAIENPEEVRNELLRRRDEAARKNGF